MTWSFNMDGNNMANDTQVSTDEQKTTFGARLKAVREAKGLERKEVAAKLRLAEKKIIMMEHERYSNDLPPIFIRGYLRAYGRLLQIPEQDINLALKSIKSTHQHQKWQTNILLDEPATNSHYFMHFFTFIIILTMFGLVGTWWYTHSSNNDMYVSNQNTLSIPPQATNDGNIDQKTS